MFTVVRWSACYGRCNPSCRSDGADFSYIDSPLIAMHEALASEAYKQTIIDSAFDDIVYSSLFTGVHGNYLKPSIRAAGLDPDNLPESDPSKMNFGETAVKPWKDIWGSGQGIGTIKEITSAARFVDRLDKEYFETRDSLISRSVVRKL